MYYEGIFTKNFSVAWSYATLIYNHWFAKPEIQGKSFILNHRIRLLATVDSLPAHGNKLIRCILNLSSKRNLCSHIFKPYKLKYALSNYNPLLGGRTAHMDIGFVFLYKAYFVIYKTKNWSIRNRKMADGPYVLIVPL